MKKLLLICLIGAVLSGCGEKVNYDWLVGEWSCIDKRLAYDKKSGEFKEQGITYNYISKFENINGQIYQIFAYYQERFDTDIFNGTQEETYNLRGGSFGDSKEYTKKSAVKINDTEFTSTFESNIEKVLSSFLFFNVTKPSMRTKSVMVCNKIN